jgi:hypothetical protein
MHVTSVHRDDPVLAVRCRYSAGYAVVGRLDAEWPEVALRVGACGYFLPLPWESVFEGERGPFRDMWTESQGKENDVPGFWD